VFEVYTYKSDFQPKNDTSTRSQLRIKKDTPIVVFIQTSLPQTLDS